MKNSPPALCPAPDKIHEPLRNRLDLLDRARLVAVIGGTLLFVRGGPREPSCDSRDIKATVLDLVQKNAGLGLSTFELDDIAKTGEDPAAGTISCKATVWANYKDTPYTYARLTYTLERQADGEINVTVEGISGLRKSILP